MNQYLNLLKRIYSEGTTKASRTGISTKSLFFLPFEHHMSEGFPLLTTKRVYFDGIKGELLWFLDGSSSIKGKYESYLKFWQPWANEKGVVPSPYGNFWRYYPWRPEFKGFYDNSIPIHRFLHKDTYDNYYFDQIAYILSELKNNPTSRRLIVMAWEPQNAIQSKLPPCHYTFVVNVTGDELNLHWTQRSCDFPIGVPFNIASYATLLLILAKATGLKPGKLAASFLDAHIYENQLSLIEEQLSRTPFELPTVIIGDKLTDDLKDIGMSQVQLLNYQSHDKIAYPVAV